MARRRSIHPNMWKDERLMECSIEARLVLIGLGTYSDYADNFRWDTDAIAKHLGGHWAVPYLDELLDVGLVSRQGNVGRIEFLFGFSRRTVSLWHRLRSAVFFRDDFTCRYCGAVNEPLHCDHIVPVSRGGKDALENLVTACRDCNLSKGSKTLNEWRGRAIPNA